MESSKKDRFRRLGIIDAVSALVRRYGGVYQGIQILVLFLSGFFRVQQSSVSTTHYVNVQTILSHPIVSVGIFELEYNITFEMKSNEGICAVLYLNYHKFIGPISFCAGAVLKWFFEWSLLGRDWLLVGVVKYFCFYNCISVLIIKTELIIECADIFRGRERLTLSKVYLLERRYHYAVFFVLWNETKLFVVSPHLLWGNILFKIA